MFQIILPHQPLNHGAQGIHADGARMVQIRRPFQGQRPFQRVLAHHGLEVLQRAAHVKRVLTRPRLHDGERAGILVLRLLVVRAARRVDVDPILGLGAVDDDAVRQGCAGRNGLVEQSAVRGY